MSVCRLVSVCFIGVLLCMAMPVTYSALKPATLYPWVDDPAVEQSRVDAAHERLITATHHPEYMLEHWVELPIAPNVTGRKIVQLRLRDAILLALRYNPNIQSAELDRIIQRYELRLAHNEFELQYALAGTAVATNSNYSGVGNATTRSYLASPEFALKNIFGTEAALSMDNNVAVDGNYNPLLNFTLKQPLLRGFGRAANEAALLDAIDSECLNKLGLQQLVMDQITQVIMAYRALILSANNLQIQQRQLAEAREAYTINRKKIAAGQLEPTVNIQQSYQIESLSLMVEQEEQDVKTTAQDLLQAIGLDPNMRIEIQSDVILNDLSVPNIKESIARALSHNLQFLALKMAVRADERTYQSAKNQQLWQLDATANVQAGTVTSVENGNNHLASIYSGNNVNESVGITLTIPLHDLNRRSVLIAAKVQLEKDRLNLIAAKRALKTTIKNTITTMESLVKRYEHAQRQVDLAEKSYELEKKKQQAGIASSLDVNNTQNQWIQAQMGLIGAKIAYLNQLSTLQQLLGTTLDYWQINLRYGMKKR